MFFLKNRTGTGTGTGQPYWQMNSALSHVRRRFSAAAAGDPRPLHARLIRRTSFPDTFSLNCAAIAYKKSGRFHHAHHLLDEMPNPNAISFNLRLSLLNHLRLFSLSLSSFSLLHTLHIPPTDVTYGLALSAAAAVNAVDFSAQVHSLTVKNGFSSNGYVVAGLVDVLSKSRRLSEAVAVFDECPSPNVVVWNAVIAGAARNGDHCLTLSLFLELAGNATSAKPNEFTLSTVLAACAGARELVMGRAVHGYAVKVGVTSDVVVGGAALDLYAKCGDRAAVAAQFTDMPVKNVVVWTTLISAFAAEDPAGAVGVFRAMRENSASAAEVNGFTVTAVLAACQSPAMARPLAQVHGLLTKSGFLFDPSVESALVNSYAKADYLPVAEKLFFESDHGKVRRNVASWATMISAWAQSRHVGCFRALPAMLKDGLLPDEICCCSVLSMANSAEFAMQIHCLCVKTGLVAFVHVSSAVFTAYSKWGSLDEAEALFLEIPDKDDVAWTSMLAGLTQHGRPDRAIELFRVMVRANGRDLDPISLSHVITACSNPSPRFLLHGMEAHGKALRLGFEAGCEFLVALLTLYFNHHLTRQAARAFALAGELRTEKEKEKLVWAAMVGGYARNGLAGEALTMFKTMVNRGGFGDCFCCSAAISACADLAVEGPGKAIHAHAVKTGGVGDMAIATALVDFYSSCGGTEEARRAFEEGREPDDVAWTALIEGYAKNGMAAEAVAAFEKMKLMGGRPDGLTFASVLAACARAGMVNEGLTAWKEMIGEYGVRPETVHRTCVVDLLGRAGRLQEAKEFVTAAGSAARAAEWAALMAACRAHGEVEMGKAAAEKAMELDPDDGGAYVALSGLAADVGDWKTAQRHRGSMRIARVGKDPGWSFLG